ncbi:MAG: glycosyltransferase [Solirubrobacteraceae bacterium]|nr:glycosyltransferase [Solirubrobacteraceae bacterium]
MTPGFDGTGNGPADDATFYRRLARHAGLPFAVLHPDAVDDADHVEVNALAAQLLTEDLCRHFCMLPVAYRDGIVTVALCDPFDRLALELATSLMDSGVQAIIAEPDDIEHMITRTFAPLVAPHFEDLGPAPPEAPRLGDLLVADGTVSDEQIEAALREQQRSGARLGDALLHAGAIGEAELVAALAEQVQMPVFDLRDGQIDADVVRLVPESVARELHAVPVTTTETALYVAVTDVLDPDEHEILQSYSDKEIVALLAPLSLVEEILEATYCEQYLHLAVDDLRERLPENCAYRVVTNAQKVFLIAIALGAAIGFVLAPRMTAIVLVSVASLFYLATSFYKFRLIYKALGHPYEVETTEDEVAALDERRLPIYSILVPLYKEAAVLPALVAAIGRLDYPKSRLDVLLLCEDDDEETILAIEQLALPPHFRLVVVPDAQPKTKPKACNYGLMLARGEVTVIFDAEDRPDPDQLKKVIVAFSKSDAAVTCVQAKLNYYNPEQNLLTRWFTTEYSMWFELLLPGLDADGAPIPLGGTSNHFITARLRELGAWDPYNVTEDADLGIRLHKAGYRTAMVDSTTLEEANSDVKNWIRQRSRWIKGYLQTYLVHMRNPLLLLRQSGFKGFASFQLLVGGTFIFLLNPIFWLLTTVFFITRAGFIQAVFPTFVFYAAAFMLFVGNFIFLYLNVAGSIQRGLYGLAKYALISPLYWGLMSIAAWKGFLQLITNPFYWEKTEHGLHAPTAGGPAPQPARGAPPRPHPPARAETPQGADEAAPARDPEPTADLAGSR